MAIFKHGFLSHHNETSAVLSRPKSWYLLLVPMLWPKSSLYLFPPAKIYLNTYLDTCCFQPSTAVFVGESFSFTFPISDNEPPSSGSCDHHPFPNTQPTAGFVILPPLLFLSMNYLFVNSVVNWPLAFST